MRNVFAKVFYLLLVAPLVPLAILYWLLEKLGDSKTLIAWEHWARKITGV